MTSFYEFVNVEFPARLDSHRNERAGQAAFNALYEVRPELANEVRGTSLDPFHRTESLSAFFAWLQEAW